MRRVQPSAWVVSKRSWRRRVGPRPPDQAECPRKLLRELVALTEASGGVDYDDPAAEAAYYDQAWPVVEQVIACSAMCAAGYRMKAQAAKWAAGGALNLGPEPAAYDRVVHSLLRDLIAAPDPCGGCRLRQGVRRQA